MANRRVGGLGPNRGRSFSQHPQFQGNVSPWQGNMSNNLNQGLVSQLSNPQQLALALSSLLQPQQQANNPPSLLSLNTSPAYSNQDRDSLGRLGIRGRSDFRRHEPYNKNRLGSGWRQLDKGGNRNNNRQGKKRSPARDNKKGADKKDNQKGKPGNAKLETIDLSTEESKDEEEVTKRDWKEEKNTTEDKKDESADDSEEKKESKDGRYHGVPQHLLHCFVCSKDMWDGESFQKHIKGRAHAQMLGSLEESFHITVNILRENMRLAEEKKMIELNRMHRLNKKGFRKFNDGESTCNMCDFKFMGKIMAHRKTEGHQRLKRFLHPDCTICSKEFPSRMEWVDHRLTPDHLRKLAEYLEHEGKGGVDGAKVIEQDLELDLEPIMDEATEMEDENPILEVTDDLTNLQNRTPAYRKNRPVGTQSLEAFTGFVCTLCNRSFTTEELSQAHLKSHRHYYKFVETIKNKYKKQIEEKERLEKEKKEKEKPENGDVTADDSAMDVSQNTDMYDPEEACKEENDGADDSQNDAADESQVSLDENESQSEAKAEAQEAAESTPTRPKRGGGVKNGAGPKSKKTRK